jgi:cellulose biosynthesis protein BcsQ
MEELDALLELSGHNATDGPPLKYSVMTVLDTDIAAWPIDKLKKVHAEFNIHIVPSHPKSGGFNARTCEALGINMDQTRQVHGKYNELVEYKLIFVDFPANQLRQEDDYFSEMRETTLSDFFKNFTSGKPFTDNVNFLDIPLPFHREEDVIVRHVPSHFFLYYTYWQP